MKPTHFIRNGTSVVAVIYKSDKFGSIVVFRERNINIEEEIEIYEIDPISEKTTKEDALEMFLEILPI